MVIGRWLYKVSLNICTDLEEVFTYPFKLSHNCLDAKERRRRAARAARGGGGGSGTTKGGGSGSGTGTGTGKGGGSGSGTGKGGGSGSGSGTGRGGRGGSTKPVQAKIVGLMDVLGLLRIRVLKGINLAVRDTLSSDPYCVVCCATQKVKTKVVRGNCNPVWNEELTIYIKDFDSPIVLCVYDKDTFTVDDSMGTAQIEIEPLIKCLKMGLQSLPDGTKVERVQPTKENCLAEESCIVWNKGKMTQDMILRLNDVECGQVQVQIEWIEIPGCKGLHTN